MPLDEALAQAAVDLSGRPYLRAHASRRAWRRMIGSYDTTLTRHIFESFVAHAADLPCTCACSSGRNPHHIVEAQFKARRPGAARAVAARTPRVAGDAAAPRARC